MRQHRHQPKQRTLTSLAIWVKLSLTIWDTKLISVSAHLYDNFNLKKKKIALKTTIE